MDLGSLDNAGAMSAQIVEGFLKHGGRQTAEQEKLLAATLDWVAHRQDRLPDGTFWRPDRKQTLWVDDLYMACSLLTRWYELTEDPRFIDDAAKQVIGMAALQQQRDGLFFHARHVGENRPAPYKWGRANGWVAFATAEVLSVLPEKHKDRGKVVDIFRRQIEGIKKTQEPSGL
jgi:rhamnogalacturonyl hydrolase YesR